MHRHLTEEEYELWANKLESGEDLPPDVASCRPCLSYIQDEARRFGYYKVAQDLDMNLHLNILSEGAGH